jgi:hypothetical protein
VAPRPYRGLATSVAVVQPSIEDSDRLLETVGAADRDESLTAADGAGAAQGLERGEGELRLGERQPDLGAEPGVPAGRGSLEAPRLLVQRQQQQRQGIRDRDLRKLRRLRPSEQEVLPGESALELAVGAPLGGHKHMFARGPLLRESPPPPGLASSSHVRQSSGPLVTIWTDLGFYTNPYAVEPVPANEEGERLFVGRDEELRVLRMYLESSAAHPTIEGQNGVGKSSLVAVAGFQASRDFEREDTAQLLIPLRERFQLDKSTIPDEFARRVYFAVAQAFIDNHDLLLKSAAEEVPNVDQVKAWLNAPIFTSREGGFSVAGTGGSYGQGSAPNETTGFSEAGFRTTVDRWLRAVFPSRDAGGFICVLDNLELLETAQGARFTLESLRDSLLNKQGLRWVLCGARGIMRGAASSPRLQGVLADPIELRPIPDDVVQDVLARRIEVFQARLDSYAPVEPDGFRHLYEVGNRNLRNALKYCNDFALWQQSEGGPFPERPDEKFEQLETWMAYLADRYQEDTSGVGNRGWEVFNGIVKMGGSAAPSEFTALGFESPQAFRGQVKPLEDAQLVESSIDDTDKRRRLIEVTSRGWIVQYQRSGYELPISPP